LILTSYRFEVPLDYDDPSKGSINIFVRRVVLAGKEEFRLPELLYLQGGPGFASPRPEGRSSWLKRATEEFQVFLLDQRGCGLSSSIEIENLTSMYHRAEDQANYLSHFRFHSERL